MKYIRPCKLSDIESRGKKTNFGFAESVITEFIESDCEAAYIPLATAYNDRCNLNNFIRTNKITNVVVLARNNKIYLIRKD